MTTVSSSAEQPVHSRLKKRSGVVVPHSPNWRQRIGAWLVFVSLRLMLRTMRYQWRDPNGVLGGPRRNAAIIAFWHNRLALCIEAYRVYTEALPGKGVAALVSASRDGGFLASVLERFGIEPVRGSSSRRGPQALLELTTWAERGYDLAITPDGPRGPCYVVQEGVMHLAQLTGLPIVPFSYSLDWKIRLKSWDRFQIPLPFSRCEMAVGAPIHVPRDATAERRAELRTELERALRELARD